MLLNSDEPGTNRSLTAIVELLEERGVLTQRDILKRMKEVRGRKKVN